MQRELGSGRVRVQNKVCARQLRPSGLLSLHVCPFIFFCSFSKSRACLIPGFKALQMGPARVSPHDRSTWRHPQQTTTFPPSPSHRCFYQASKPWRHQQECPCPILRRPLPLPATTVWRHSFISNMRRRSLPQRRRSALWELRGVLRHNNNNNINNSNQSTVRLLQSQSK